MIHGKKPTEFIIDDIHDEPITDPRKMEVWEELKKLLSENLIMLPLLPRFFPTASLKDYRVEIVVGVDPGAGDESKVVVMSRDKFGQIKSILRDGGEESNET